ncbi:hypothetical protein SNARM312S_07965 [Streptomyces narbonensis]
MSLVKGGQPLLSQVKMGLGWEPAYRGKDIDLDASVIAYGPQRNHLDSCYFGKLSILNGSIKHSGDNLTGEGAGDDEVIVVDLGRLPADATGLVFTVNSFSGQKFTEVAKAYCRLMDAATGEELVRFDLTTAEPQTGVMMAKLIKQFSGEWEMTAMGEFVKSRTVRARRSPPPSRSERRAPGPSPRAAGSPPVAESGRLPARRRERQAPCPSPRAAGSPPVPPLREQGAVTVEGGLAARVGVENGRVPADLSPLHQVDQTRHRLPLVDGVGDHALGAGGEPHRVEGGLVREAVDAGADARRVRRRPPSPRARRR